MKLLIITGMSGAGKSHALRKLEDMGFFCVDNLPSAMLLDFAGLCEKSTPAIEKAAIVMDVRERGFLGGIDKALEALGGSDIKLKLLFLDARDEVLVTRYKETRRTHPFSQEGWLEEGIRKERQALASLHEMADFVIDTSDLKPAQLYLAIENTLNEGEGIKLLISSFGFKRGVPLDADWVLDMRFLPNPFYIKELRPLTGQDKQVGDYVFGFEEAGAFFESITKTLFDIIPMYQREDKHTLSIAVGCTGGQHRSVAFAEAIGEFMRGKGLETYVYHRDISKDRGR